MSQPEHSHSVRRVVLPSGKTIDVVYFHDEPVVARRGARETPEAEPLKDLHICPSCEAPFVYPTAWREAGLDHWEVELRCPNCEWSGAGIFDQELVERFDQELDRGTAALLRDLQRLVHANMQDEIDRFVAALDAGHVLPMDF